MEYGSTGFTNKLYYLSNTVLNTTTQFINLLLTDGTTQVKFEVVDTLDDPVDDVQIKVLTYDVATDSSTLSEIVQTGSDGLAYAQIVLNTQFYKFILVKDGNILLETDQVIIDSTSKKFRIDLGNQYQANYENFLGLSYNNITFTNATKTFSTSGFTDASNTASEWCLTVNRRQAHKDVLIGEVCDVTAAGSLSLNISEAVGSNTYVASFKVKFSNGDEFHLNSLIKSFDEVFKKFALSGLFATFLVILTLAMASLWNPTVGVVLVFVGLIFAVVMKLVFISWGVIAALIIVGGLALYKLTR
jgi:hypothetical protein